jgi:hypothetical protein
VFAGPFPDITLCFLGAGCVKLTEVRELWPGIPDIYIYIGMIEDKGKRKRTQIDMKQTYYVVLQLVV